MTKKFTWKDPVVKPKTKTHSFNEKAPAPKKRLTKELPRTRDGNLHIDDMKDTISERNKRSSR